MAKPFTQKPQRVAIDTPLGTDHFLLLHFAGREEMSRLFTYHAYMVRDPDKEKSGPVDPTKIVGKNVTIENRYEWDKEGNKPKATAYINGHVRRFVAAGTVVVTYDASTGFGGKSKGITYQTRPGSLVVAPWDGQIAFAGPFRSFGQILIIEHGEGYHSLLAGMGRIDAPVGQWVLAGEPVGITGGEVGATTTKIQNQSRLYVELRRDGQPINPLPWLAAATTR